MLNALDLTTYDLRPVQIILALSGSFLAMAYMQMVSQDKIEPGEKTCFKWLRRVGIALTATGLLWSASFGIEKDWQPWPPFIVLCIGINCSLIAAVVTGQFKRKQETNRALS